MSKHKHFRGVRLRESRTLEPNQCGVVGSRSNLLLRHLRVQSGTVHILRNVRRVFACEKSDENNTAPNSHWRRTVVSSSDFRSEHRGSIPRVSTNLFLAAITREAQVMPFVPPITAEGIPLH